jgi:thiamine biosynthesis lipoprotein
MIYSEEQVFMNTIVRIQVVSGKGTVFTKKKIRDSFGNFSRVVEKFSRFSGKSELSILNAHSGKKFEVSGELFKLISYSLELAEISGGAYDPTIIDLLEAYGYDKKMDFEKLNDPGFFDEIKKMTKNRPGYKEIELDVKNLTVKLAPGQRIDLGSVGKGYAIDLTFDELEKEFEHFLINAGGDVRVNGLNEKGLYWKIMLYKAPLPNQPASQAVSQTASQASSLAVGREAGQVASQAASQAALGLVEMAPGTSIAGSGGWARRVGAFHHLLSPFDGLPININSQSFVIAPTATEADGWSTLLFVKGKSALPSLYSHNFAGLLIDFQGNISRTDNFYYSSF